MLNKFVILGALSLVLLGITDKTIASSTPVCAYEPKYSSIEELVRASTYIGVYYVTEAEPSKEITKGGFQLFSYKLHLESNIYGDAPINESVVGIFPYDRPPAYYFAILERHRVMADDFSENLSHTYWHPFSDVEECRVLPQFVVGFSYLIFGGIESRAGFEFIADGGVDPWFKAVNAVARSMTVDDAAIQVEEIVNTPQAYDGEQVNQLVELGSDGVAAIGRALATSDYKFPIVYLYALERLADPAGTPAIVSFISNRAPHTDFDTLSDVAVRALGSTGGSQAVEALKDLFESTENNMRIRVMAASSLQRVASGPLRKRAEAFITELYKESRSTRDFSQISAHELFEGLMATDSPYSRKIAINAIQSREATPSIIEAVARLSRSEDAEDMQQLAEIAQSPSDYAISVRLAAIRAIVNSGESHKYLPDELAAELREESRRQELPLGVRKQVEDVADLVVQRR